MGVRTCTTAAASFSKKNPGPASEPELARVILGPPLLQARHAMGSPFFTDSKYINRIAACCLRFIGAFREKFSVRRVLKTARAASHCRSDCDFGENVHAADLRRHPKFRSLFFHADDCGLAAYPALFARSQFGRKNQDQFNVGALLHAGLGVEKDSVGAHIAGLRSLIGTVGGAHARGNPRWDSSSGTALGVDLHGRSANYCTPM